MGSTLSQGSIISAAIASIVLALSPAPAAAVNEGYNPRAMEKANRHISQYESKISGGAATVENYEGLIEGYRMRMDAYFSKSDTSDTESSIYETYKKIEKIAPDHYTAAVEMIAREMVEKKFAGLEERAKKVVEANQSGYRGRLILGELRFYGADFDGAIMEITRGISLVPAGSEKELDRYKKLLAAANKFSAILKKSMPTGEPKTHEDMLAAAKVFLSPEMSFLPANADKGIALLKKCAEKNERDAAVLIMLGEALGEVRGEYKEAMKILRKVEAASPEKAQLKRARNLSQRYYKLDLESGTKKKGKK